MSRKIWIGIVVLAIVAVCVIALMPRGNDSDQIHNALSTMIKASKEGRPGGVVDYLDRSVNVNGTEYSTYRELANAIKKYKPDLEVENMTPEVQGDQATIVSPIKLSILTRSIEVPGVVFHFERESTTHFLIIPAKDWKLRSVEVPDSVLQDVASQFDTGGPLPGF